MRERFAEMPVEMPDMITVINFSHPLVQPQIEAIESLTEYVVDRKLDFAAQFDHTRPLAEQVRELVDAVGLSYQEWQTELILVNLPGHGVLAACLLAELHGRMGYLPAIIRIRPVSEFSPPRYEVAEIINLQWIRDGSRSRRRSSKRP